MTLPRLFLGNWFAPFDDLVLLLMQLGSIWGWRITCNINLAISGQ